VIRAGFVCALMAVATAPAIAQTPSAELSAIAQAAEQRGIKTCLPAIDRLAKNLAANFDIGVFLFNQVEQPDLGLVSISMELSPAPSGSGSAYVSASFAPLASGACQVMVESTMSWTNRCTTVGVGYQNYQAVGTLLREIGILSDGGTQRLFLMPGANNGCISIEKSVYF
jgi:hypothetical protein